MRYASSAIKCVPLWYTLPAHTELSSAKKPGVLFQLYANVNEKKIPSM